MLWRGPSMSIRVWPIRILKIGGVSEGRRFVGVRSFPVLLFHIHIIPSTLRYMLAAYYSTLLLSAHRLCNRPTCSVRGLCFLYERTPQGLVREPRRARFDDRVIVQPQYPILDIMYEYSIPSAESLLFVEKIRSTSREGNTTCWPPVAKLISDGWGRYFLDRKIYRARTSSFYPVGLPRFGNSTVSLYVRALEEVNSL